MGVWGLQVIRHEGRVVCESDDIVEYLDTAFPTAGASLLPADSAAEVRRWVGWGGATLLPSGKRAVLGGGGSERKALLTALQELEAHLVAQPAERAAIGGAAAAGAGAGAEGGALTMADCSLFPMLWRLKERGAGGYDAAALPALDGWLARTAAIPAVASTLTKDWWWWW